MNEITVGQERFKQYHILDGMARGIANGTYVRKPADSAHTPELLSVVQAEGSSEKHHYDQMCEDACKRFIHCQEEIKEFFIRQKERHKRESLEESANSVGHSSLNYYWTIFWQGIKELNLERHNEKARAKKQAKKQHAPQEVFLYGRTIVKDKNYKLKTRLKAKEKK